MSIFESITRSEPVEKGWSSDKKYRVAAGGAEYLLRVSPPKRRDARRALYAKMRECAALGVPMNEAVETGDCAGGAYLLCTWIDGQDAEDVVPQMSAGGQYLFGEKCGKILRKIHSIPAPDTQEPWAERFGRKTRTKIARYRECGLRFEGDRNVTEYLDANFSLLEGRPQCFQHGDYHIGNFMVRGGEPVIIDFDRCDYGDPWEEFNRIVWCAQASPPMARGMVRGYFGGEPPELFWRLLAFYIASNTLSAMYWAIPFGEEEVAVMLRQAGDVLDWYDGMRRVVPKWYTKPQ